MPNQQAPVHGSVRCRGAERAPAGVPGTEMTSCARSGTGSGGPVCSTGFCWFHLGATVIRLLGRYQVVVVGGDDEDLVLLDTQATWRRRGMLPGASGRHLIIWHEQRRIKVEVTNRLCARCPGRSEVRKIVKDTIMYFSSKPVPGKRENPAMRRARARCDGSLRGPPPSGVPNSIILDHFFEHVGAHVVDVEGLVDLFDHGLKRSAGEIVSAIAGWLAFTRWRPLASANA